MAIFDSNTENIEKAAKLINAGEVIAFPTETVYGLGANALNGTAVAKVFETKNRPHFDPLIIHIAELSQLENYAEASELAFSLANKFWPGALTLVLKKKSIVPDIVTSGLSTVAIRMPAHQVALDFIQLAGKPIAAPSANPFGYLSPTTAEHVENQLGDIIPMILDGGPCQTGVESTIIDLSTSQPTLLRAGGIVVDEIELVTGKLEQIEIASNPKAPGQLKQHYAPRKKLVILSREEMLKDPDFKVSGVLALTPWAEKQENQLPKRLEVLSKNGDLKEAATNLFAAMHRLDDSDVKIIFAEPVEEKGLGMAIMDRLRRAAATFS